MRSLLLITFLLNYCTGFCQLNNYRFTNLNVQNGLSNNQVNCIYKDRKGFIWIGASAGLNIGGTQPNTRSVSNVREHLLMDFDWRFAFGHPYEPHKDFNNGASYFSYFAKAGYGDGAASAHFDDRAWRKLDLPHDWAVEQSFSPKASFSHGFKAIGRNFPEVSVGWYRKKFDIPASDWGKRIHITFDGVFRHSIVWVNGHYLGTENSGYTGFEYDITDYLNYGGENTVAVRVDATMEEGWFYEGAGIYRHVWLDKTNDLNVAPNGVFVTTQLKNVQAELTAGVTLNNEGKTIKTVDIQQTVVDQQGRTITGDITKQVSLLPFKSKEFSCVMNVPDPKLWSVDSPYLYKLITILSDEGVVIDRTETIFGIRSIRFDPNEGCFLNGKRIEIKGTNNHQDHAGVGSAIPDALQTYRIMALKAIGCNAYRCSHNPPTRELLDACDRLGMLVIDENRQMGITSTHLDDLKSLILRDRNHPCVISWSIGNEEWGIENTVTGARIAATMQAYAKSIDSSRAITAAFSGGWGSGLSAVMDLIGFNYIAQEKPDEQHKKFPLQAGWGTEEGSTYATRGIYFDDTSRHMLSAYDKKPRPKSYSIEEGWNYYASRPFLAGMFIWTGFDYRGEATPFDWPSVGSYFGMLDQCGFPKDDAWYLKSWWTNDTILHLLPHWNWKGREGQTIPVWAYSNCEEVEVFLNKKSMGKKNMPVNGHLEWEVPYHSGTLEAIGYRNGKKVAKETVRTTGEPVSVQLTTNRDIQADKKDIAVITVDTRDKNGWHVPTATNEIQFSIAGPGKIIGVGNGDPTSLEADKYLPVTTLFHIDRSKGKPVSGLNSIAEMKETYNGTFNLPDDLDHAAFSLFYNSIGKEQSIYINGKEIAHDLAEDKKGNIFKLEQSILHPGINQLTILATPLSKENQWDVANSDPGVIQMISVPAGWKRKLFSGLAQVIIQATDEPGEIELQATSDGLNKGTLLIRSSP